MINNFFKEFEGNKAEFVAAGHDKTYVDKLVCIKDEANNGAGACIYARGSYFGNFAELIAAITYIKNVKVGENTYSREGGATIEFASGANSQVVLDVQNGKVTISLTPTFVQSVNEVIAEVAIIKDDYLTSADKTELAGRIKANTDAIAVLNGNSTTDGSVDKKISDAINAFASAATDNGTIDTFKELVEYVASHGTEFSELVGEVDANTKDIETLKGGVNVAGSVDKKIEDAISDLAHADTVYTKAEIEAMFAWEIIS